MANVEALRSRLDGIRRLLLAHYEAGVSMPSAVKGSEREILVREFLSKVFPPPYRFGAGSVMDAAGRQSGQLDIVVEFPFLPSFPTIGAPERLYLVESVAAVLEVKSNVRSQWGQIKKTAARVQPLRREWRAHSAVTSKGDHDSFGPSLSRLPILAVGYRGPKTSEELQRLLDNCLDHERPDGILVLDSGAYTGCSLCESTRAGTGAAGLLAFTNDLSWIARNVVWAAPTIGSYLDAL